MVPFHKEPGCQENKYGNCQYDDNAWIVGKEPFPYFHEHRSGLEVEVACRKINVNTKQTSRSSTVSIPIFRFKSVCNRLILHRNIHHLNDRRTQEKQKAIGQGET
jgi:hypothetical protein